MTQKTTNIILGILTVLAFSFIQIIYNHSFTWALFYEQSIFSAFLDLFYQFLTWDFKITFLPEQNAFICTYFFLCVCLLTASFLNKKIYIIISIFSLYVFLYAIIYVFGGLLEDFEISSVPFFIISVAYLLALFKQKIILTAFLLGIFDIFIYMVFSLLLMGYDDFYHESKGEYWSLASMTTFQKIVYISLHIWNILNIIVLIFVLYKVGKAVFNYFRKSEKSQII